MMRARPASLQQVLVPRYPFELQFPATEPLIRGLTPYIRLYGATAAKIAGNAKLDQSEDLCELVRIRAGSSGTLRCGRR